MGKRNRNDRNSHDYLLSLFLSYANCKKIVNVKISHNNHFKLKINPYYILIRLF